MAYRKKKKPSVVMLRIVIDMAIDIGAASCLGLGDVALQKRLQYVGYGQGVTFNRIYVRAPQGAGLNGGLSRIWLTKGPDS